MNKEKQEEIIVDADKKDLADALTIYINEKHTQEECIGFIDGFKVSRIQERNKDVTGKHNPKNKEEAFCHQFEHDVKLCFSMSQFIHRKDDYETKKQFQDALNILKIHIASYEETKYT